MERPRSGSSIQTPARLFVMRNVPVSSGGEPAGVTRLKAGTTKDRDFRREPLADRPDNRLMTPARRLGRMTGRGVVLMTVAGLIWWSSADRIAHQDVVSLILDRQGDRWLARVTRAPGESAHGARLALTEVGGETTAARGSKSSAAIALEGAPIGDGNLPLPVETDSLPAFPKPPAATAPPVVNRTGKGDRLITTLPGTERPPAEDPGAGTLYKLPSMLSRQSLLELPPGSFDPNPPVQVAAVSSFRPYDPTPVVVVAEAPKPIIKPVRVPESTIALAKPKTPGAEKVFAYAPVGPDIEEPFRAVLNPPAVGGDDLKLKRRSLARALHPWADNPLPAGSNSERQLKCLAEGIYFESRGEIYRGQAAVAQVILNRVKNPHYPDTICGVVYHNAHWRNRCQFSFACDRIADRVRDQPLWDQAMEIARLTVKGDLYDDAIGDSTHYHATYVAPPWRRKMIRLTRIGVHIFYRTRGGGWI